MKYDHNRREHLGGGGRRKTCPAGEECSYWLLVKEEAFSVGLESLVRSDYPRRVPECREKITLFVCTE